MTLRTALSAALLAGVFACASPVPPPAAETRASAQAASETPPTVDGVYVARGACPGEGCTFGHWRATKPTPVYDAIGASPRVVATLAPGERIEAVTGEVHLKPVRGVVRRDSGELKAGDVIYQLDYQGEGQSNVWRRGQILTWSDEGGDPASSDVAWDPGDTAADWWVSVRRADGSRGWLRNPDSFACSDSLSGDEGCER